MLDDDFEERLKDAARSYNEPPVTPREEMWGAIQRQRGQKAQKAERSDVVPMRPLRPRRPLRPLHLLPLSAAALLALGFALGRLTDRGDPTPAETTTIASHSDSARANSTAYDLATTDHLSQSEAFLTLFKASISRNGSDQLTTRTARQLLATNRLLLDSPASNDARIRLLLQDLELVLAEIAQLSSSPRRGDLDLISEGMERGGVLTRLRTAVPSGPGTTQGVL